MIDTCDTLIVFSNDEVDISVFLGTIHPECKCCDDDCTYCRVRFKEPCRYSVHVQYPDYSTTTDVFDKFSDAFDSFVGIVKTLTEEDDWKQKKGDN